MPFRPSASLLSQPPMNRHPTMAPSSLGEPTFGLHDHGSLMGFRCMVAPTSQTASTKVQGLDSSPLSRHVPQLLGRTFATPKVASPLRSVIREVLQRREISSEDIEAYLNQQGSLDRHQSTFKLLWFQCEFQGLVPLSLSLLELAGQLLSLHKLSPAKARNAYSALLLIPRLDQLWFSPTIEEHPLEGGYYHCLAPRHLQFEK